MEKSKKTSKKDSSSKAKRKGSVPHPELQNDVKGGNVNEEVRFTQTVVKRGLRNCASHHIESFDYTIQKLLPRIC